MLLETPQEDESRADAIGISSPYVSRILAAFEQEEQQRLAQKRDATATHQHPPMPLSPLSRQEQQVLQKLVAGLTYAEMAKGLTVSPNTIKTQVSSIYRKQGVSRRAEAIRAAQRLHLL